MKRIVSITLLITCIQLFCAFIYYESPTKSDYKFPYKEAGLTKRQAAAHLMSRFSYGAKSGEISQVVSKGLEIWFQQQLTGNLPDDTLKILLQPYKALTLSNTEVVHIYPKRGQVLRMAMREGKIDKDSVNKSDKKEYKEKLRGYMDEKGFRPERELMQQFVSQKILRAAYSNNQLQEVLTEFWFNHFNVSFTKNDCAPFIPAYERDVIRPNALGNFETLLLATAKSPAMLRYLDNFSSVGTNADKPKTNLKKSTKPTVNKQKGLNENYAREVMELHTLGVDGGYTQTDVTEAARVLTGWTLYPMNTDGNGSEMRNKLESASERQLSKRGVVHEGDFLFTLTRHDSGEKVVLGNHFAPGGGYEEGERLLKILAYHPSTAKFISKKIAIRFVSDNPPQSLLDKLEKAFIKKNGDIRELLLTLVSSPEFWSPSSLREKTKSPFELAISAVRSLHAEINEPFSLSNWITRMGQKIYFYQAPTGFPDRAQYWINTGSLLNRMNFGLALASQRIPGVTFDLLKLNNNHEPESATDALLTFSKLMMPERNIDETIKRLTPLLNDPDLQNKVGDAAHSATSVDYMEETNEFISSDTIMAQSTTNTKAHKNVPNETRTGRSNDYRLSQVIGIIIGSPEFQRR